VLVDSLHHGCHHGQLTKYLDALHCAKTGVGSADNISFRQVRW